jgi:CheY-like chemotaxis protein
MAKRIAVVNDDSMFLALMETILREEGGYEALVLRETTAAFPKLEAWCPDAIFLDLLLERPDSGWALLEMVRLHPATRDTPVIICSADARGLRDREEDLRRHRCEILPKPFDLEELLSLVRRLVGPGDTAPQGQ